MWKVIRWPLNQAQQNTKQKLMRMQSAGCWCPGPEGNYETLLQNVRVLHKWRVFYACTWADAISQKCLFCQTNLLFLDTISIKNPRVSRGTWQADTKIYRRLMSQEYLKHFWRIIRYEKSIYQIARVTVKL